MRAGRTDTDLLAECVVAGAGERRRVQRRRRRVHPHRKRRHGVQRPVVPGRAHAHAHAEPYQPQGVHVDAVGGVRPAVPPQRGHVPPVPVHAIRVAGDAAGEGAGVRHPPRGPQRIHVAVGQEGVVGHLAVVPAHHRVRVRVDRLIPTYTHTHKVTAGIGRGVRVEEGWIRACWGNMGRARANKHQHGGTDKG